ncbi:DUF6454 family protein [Terrarubrum flagellatum]|uniref:DUF6454 family protein n=1 Tax=Terrirubrum flagellatum TaxID=2895980 RepID=UPI003145343F
MDRRSFLVGASAVAASAAVARAADPLLAQRVPLLTRNTVWKQVGAIPVQFPTFHPQGMVKIGEDFYFSSVDIRTPTKRFPQLQNGYDRDTGEGVGYLFKMDKQGKLVSAAQLGEGSIYHPGGIDYDGKYIWVPAAEYRPNSRSIIYRVDPEKMKGEEMFRFGDHIGGLACNTDDKSLHGVSWGSRRFYAWTLDSEGKPANADKTPEQLRVANPALYIDYQDCHYVGGSKMLCSGVNNYRASTEGAVFRLGGVELVDLKTNSPVWQVPIELWSMSGLPMTQNPFWFEPIENGVRAYFMPDDDKSNLFIYEALTS